MNYKAKVIILVILVFKFFILPETAFSSEPPWQLRTKKEGIAVYTRKVNNSPILEYKSNMIIDEPLNKVVQLFEDDSKITQWYYQCTHAEVIEKENSGNKIYYFILHLPWPVTERDCVFQRIKSTDSHGGAIIYKISAIPKRVPNQKGKIRVLAINSVWRFTPLKDGKTEVYFQQHSEPGGIIPSFLVNKLSVEIPFNTLRNFRKMTAGNKG